MVQETSRSSDKQIDTLLELVSLTAALSASDHDPVRFAVVLETVTSPLIVVHGQLSRRGDDQYACALLWSEIGASKGLHSRDHVSERLSTAGLGSSEHVPAVQNVRDGTRLDLRGSLEAELFHSFLRLLEERQLTELYIREVGCI